MKLPALYRKRRGAGGAYYGSYLAKLQGVEVSLNTKNAAIAHERLVEALRGKREWPSDAELAAQALEGGPAAAAAAGPPAPDAGVPGDIPAPAAAASTAPPIVPDHIEPPRQLPPMPASSPAADAQAEAEATNAAAAETGGQADAGATPPPGLDIGPDALEGMLQGAATALVQAQIDLQAWVIERRTGKRPQPLPEKLDAQLVAPLRDAAAKAWVVQFKRWFPDMADVPPWILALGLPLLIAPIQVATAVPVEKQPDPPAAQAAA